MGKPNNALSVYMNRSDRIRSVLEYYLGERLPEDWSCEEIRGQYSVWESRNSERNAKSEHGSGHSAVGALMKRLLAEGRQEELLKAAEDGIYLQKLLSKYSGSQA